MAGEGGCTAPAFMVLGWTTAKHGRSKVAAVQSKPWNSRELALGRGMTASRDDACSSAQKLGSSS